MRHTFKALLSDIVYRSNYCTVNNRQDTGDNKALKEFLRLRYSAVITCMTHVNIVKSEGGILQISDPYHFFSKMANLLQINLNIFQHGISTYWCYPENLKLETSKYMYDLKMFENGKVTLEKTNVHGLNVPNSEGASHTVPGDSSHSETYKIKKSVPVHADRQNQSVNPSTLHDAPILPNEWYTPEAHALMSMDNLEDNILSARSHASDNNAEKRNTWNMTESLRTETLSVSTCESESGNSDTTDSSCSQSKDVNKKTVASASNVDATDTHPATDKTKKRKEMETSAEDECEEVKKRRIDSETEQDNETAAAEHDVLIKGCGIEDFLTHVKDCVDKSEMRDSVAQMRERLKIISHTMNAWQQIISKGDKMLKNFEFTIEDDDEPPVLQCSGCVVHCCQDYRVAGVRGRPRKQTEKESLDKKSTNQL